MARLTMRLVAAGEIPPDGGTAVQESPDRPVFKGNGPDDYVCAQCGTVLAHAMAPQYMNHKLRVRCAGCRKVNAAVEVEGIDYASVFRRRPADG